MAKEKETSLSESCRTILRGLKDSVLRLVSPTNFTLTDDEPKRARTGKGRYKGDDKSTKDVNEAWVGGKAPKKKKRKK